RSDVGVEPQRAADARRRARGAASGPASRGARQAGGGGGSDGGADRPAVSDLSGRLLLGSALRSRSGGQGVPVFLMGPGRSDRGAWDSVAAGGSGAPRSPERELHEQGARL